MRRSVERVLPAELQALNCGFFILRKIGLWEAAGSCRIVRYFVIASYLLTAIIIPKAVFGSGQEGFDSTARNLAELIFCSEVCLSAGIFVIRRKSFAELIELLREIVERYRSSEKCTEEIRAFNRRTDRIVRAYLLYIIVLAFLFLAIPIGTSVCMWLFVAENKRRDYFVIVEMEFWSLDIRRNILHYCISLLVCTPPLLCSAYQTTFKGSVFLVIIQFGAKLFELIEMRIKCLDQVAAGQERKDELREIVELHQLSLQYVKLLESTMNFILMNQIMNCMLMWCLMLFYLTTNFGPNATSVLVFFIVLMTEMMIYCFSGNYLSERAAAVGDAVYSYPWYEEPASMQKDMLMILRRAQRPTGVTAARFYFVNIERLRIVFQASYSYYLLLKNLF